MSITSGTVRFEDGIKAGEEYAPPRKVAVELHFDIDPTLSEEGVNTTLAAMGDKAKSMVYEMLGAKAPPKKEPIGNNSPQRRHAVADTAPKDAAKANYAATAEAAPKGGAADMAEFDVKPEAAEEDLTTASVAPVSDADLNSAVQKKNAEIKNPQAIRDLIGAFNPDPAKAFTLAEIPQAQRRTFLDKLGALKPKT